MSKKGFVQHRTWAATNGFAGAVGCAVDEELEDLIRQSYEMVAGKSKPKAKTKRPK